MKRPRRELEPSAGELVEEAVHLLRRASAGTLAIYFAGTIPFALGLLFFWAHTTWFLPSGERVAWGALALVVLFAVMKVAQVEFCARLLAQRLGATPPLWSWARAGRILLGQARLQPWALLATFGSALLTVPFGWVYAYAQNATVLGAEERTHEIALQQAKLWPRQNHVGLALLTALAVGAAINLATAFAVIPWLANRLLGIENIFGVSGWWYLNTTFLASVALLTWLAVDPVVKGFYALRVFHGRARTTGEDIRVELLLARRARQGMRAVALLAILSLALPGRTLGAEAAPSPPAPVSAVEPGQLDRAIDEVLTGADFSWRLRPPPGQEPTQAEGALKRFVRQGVDMLKDTVRTVGRWLRDVIDWLERRLSADPRPWRPRASGGETLTLLRGVLYVFIAVAVLVIAWLIWLMIRNARRSRAPVLTAAAVTAATPDLRDENVQAAQLPADGWLALAREQAARGEWRLALRALYLATLARLAADGWVSLAKFKTNLDYERELRRRALSRAEIVAHFAQRRRTFEDVWYGRTEAGESEVRAWMAELERPTMS